MKNYIYFILLIAFLNSCNSSENGIIPGAIRLNCDYNSSITLTNRNSNGPDYYADCDVFINAGTMIIEPGTEIVFIDNASLTVNSSAGLIAEGTSLNKIIFRGSNTNIHWGGIKIYSNNPTNSLKYCDVLNATSEEVYLSFGAGYESGAIIIDGRCSLTNNTINNSLGSGFIFGESTKLNIFSNNIVSNVEGFPVLAYAGCMDINSNMLSCIFTSNGNNKIALFGITSNQSSENDMELFKANIPYIIITEIDFSGNHNIIINEGVQIEFESGKSIGIRGTGSFQINGTVSEPVIMKGVNEISGFWKGIYIETNNPLNVFSFLEIYDGGNTSTILGLSPANISIGSTSRLIINDCISERYDGSCSVVKTTTSNFTNNSPTITNVCNE